MSFQTERKNRIWNPETRSYTGFPMSVANRLENDKKYNKKIDYKKPEYLNPGVKNFSNLQPIGNTN